MKTVFVIKLSKGDFPVFATWDEGTAKQTVKELNSRMGDGYCNYIEVPIHFEQGTEINVIAPPIQKEYLPSSERTLMGNFKADAE